MRVRDKNGLAKIADLLSRTLHIVKKNQHRDFLRNRKREAVICHVSMAKSHVFEKQQKQKQASFRAFHLKKRWFYGMKPMVSSAENGGMRISFQWNEKTILLFAGVKIIYYSDYQRLAPNAENRRYFASKGNALANTRCMCA